MQASAQAHVDSAISKTINLPEDIAFDAFQDVYLLAWNSGCKGCTTYRPNRVTGAVLAVSAPSGAAKQREASLPMERPETLPGSTYKIKWPESDHALYITLTDIVEAVRRRPFAVFINSTNMEHYAWTFALTRILSAVFPPGAAVSYAVPALQAALHP